MNYTLESTTYEFELRNPEYIKTHEDEQLLIKTVTDVLFNKKTQREVQNVPYTNGRIDIQKHVSANGSKFFISKSPERKSGQNRARGETKGSMRSEGVYYKEKAVIKDKSNVMRQFLKKEFKKDQIKSNLPVDFGKGRFSKQEKPNVFGNSPKLTLLKKMSLDRQSKPTRRFKMTGEFNSSNLTTQTFGKPGN